MTDIIPVEKLYSLEALSETPGCFVKCKKLRLVEEWGLLRYKFDVGGNSS